MLFDRSSPGNPMDPKNPNSASVGRTEIAET